MSKDENGRTWLGRNLTLQTVVSLILLVGGLAVAGYTFASKVDAGAKAAIRLDVVEKDYVGKEELKGHLGTIHGKINKIESKIDKLTGAILKRLPSDDDE